MRSLVKIYFLVVLLGCLYTTANAQITAFTIDGKKVLLYPDGTWKYVFEDGPGKFIPDTVSTRLTVPPVDSVKTVAVDSTKRVPVKPPVKRVPLNLDCSNLVAVERSIEGDRWVAQSKTIKVATDSTAGFGLSFYKSKNGPLIWTTALTSKGHCIGEENKMMVVMNDGTRFQVINNGKANCDGNFKLYFGGTFGHEIQSDAMKVQTVSAIRVWTSNSFVEENFSEDHSALFKAMFNCMLSTK